MTEHDDCSAPPFEWRGERDDHRWAILPDAALDAYTDADGTTLWHIAMRRRSVYHCGSADSLADAMARAEQRYIALRHIALR